MVGLLLASMAVVAQPNTRSSTKRPSNRAAYDKFTATELGNDPKPQLYNLADDLGEKRNMADQFPERVQQMKQQLDKIRTKEAQ